MKHFTTSRLLNMNYLVLYAWSHVINGNLTDSWRVPNDTTTTTNALIVHFPIVAELGIRKVREQWFNLFRLGFMINCRPQARKKEEGGRQERGKVPL